MPRNWWTIRNLVFVAAIVSLACVAALVGIGLVYPEPVSSAALGPIGSAAGWRWSGPRARG